MDIQSIMNNVIALFLIMLAGVYGVKTKIITKELNRGLSAILLNITLPTLVISSFNFSYGNEMKQNVVRAFLYGLIFFVLAVIISYVFLLPLRGEKKKVLQFGNAFSNCGFMGFPIIASIFGGEGVIYTSIFNMYFGLFLWTYGVMLFSNSNEDKNFKGVLLNPGIVAVYIGVFMMIFNIKLPEVLYSSLDMIGSTTTPISMIIIGATLARVNFRSSFKDWTIYYGSFIKLIIIPIILYLVSRLLGLNDMVINTLIVLQALPAAATTTIFAEKYEKETEYAAVLVFTTTLLCIVTLPIILYLIK